MSERMILHSDMNSFYASVEAMLDPSLRGKAVAVCGSAEDRHGIILAKSERAKKAGVKTGMVNWEAKRLCPELILVPPQYEQYMKYSKLAREIYCRYTDQVEPFGMDECWLDVTDRTWGHGSAENVAQEIRASVKEELGLTVSVGVSFSKVFAKLGSDMKKPDAVTVISRESYREQIWPLDASELIYIGRSTTAALRRNGIRTIGELASTSPELLMAWFGVNGIKMWHYANGTDDSRVTDKDFVSPIKSIGHGITCVADLENNGEVYRVLLELSQDVGHRLRVNGLTAQGVQIAVRANTLETEMYQCRLPCTSRLSRELADAGYRLFRERYRWTNKVRTITIRAINLLPENPEEQYSIFEDNERREKREKLEGVVDGLRGRYGKHALTYASLLQDIKMPDDGRDIVRMPGIMYQ